MTLNSGGEVTCSIPVGEVQTLGGSFELRIVVYTDRTYGLQALSASSENSCGLYLRPQEFDELEQLVSNVRARLNQLREAGSLGTVRGANSSARSSRALGTGGDGSL